MTRPKHTLGDFSQGKGVKRPAHLVRPSNREARKPGEGPDAFFAPPPQCLRPAIVSDKPHQWPKPYQPSAEMRVNLGRAAFQGKMKAD